VQAVYAGSSDFASSTGTLTSGQTVNAATLTVAVTPTVTIAYGSSTAVNVVATFAGTGISGDGAPSGVVTFTAAGAIGGTFNFVQGSNCVTGGTNSTSLICTVSYKPSGTLAAGNYAGAFTASIAAGGNYQAGGPVTGSLTVTGTGTPVVTIAPSPVSIGYSSTAAVSVVPTVLTTVPPPASPAPAVTNPAAGASTPPAAFVPSGGNEPAPDTDLTAARAAGSNPADDEPAVAAPRRPARAVEATAAPTSEAELPSLSELGGAVPALRLDLHVYADRPADRYALINMHKARGGDMLPEGARVVAIDRDGVELSYHGTQFMLRPQ